jgi:MoaA/NifB/PqqE/SkfB family radical SAM enzyme
MVPFYEYYQQIYGYAGKPALNEMILNPNTWEINELVNRMHLTTSLDSHGYETILIKDPEDPFTQLTALHTTSVHNIEKIAYSAPSLEAKIALIWMLQIYINMHEIEYCEWWVPSSDLSQIRSLIDYGFGILGYVPAWSPVAADSHVFEDVAILGWSRIPLDRSKLRLIPEGNTFLNIFNTPF